MLRTPGVSLCASIARPVNASAKCYYADVRAGSFDASVEETPLFSLRENAIAQEPGRVILRAGGVCLDSVLHWWLDSFESSP